MAKSSIQLDAAQLAEHCKRVPDEAALFLIAQYPEALPPDLDSIVREIVSRVPLPRRGGETLGADKTNADGEVVGRTFPVLAALIEHGFAWPWLVEHCLDCIEAISRFDMRSATDVPEIDRSYRAVVTLGYIAPEALANEDAIARLRALHAFRHAETLGGELLGKLARAAGPDSDAMQVLIEMLYSEDAQEVSSALCGLMLVKGSQVTAELVDALVHCTTHADVFLVVNATLQTCLHKAKGSPNFTAALRSHAAFTTRLKDLAPAIVAAQMLRAELGI